MKAEHAGPLLELASSKCSSVKYDVAIVEEYFARQVCELGVRTGRAWLTLWVVFFFFFATTN